MQTIPSRKWIQEMLSRDLLSLLYFMQFQEHRQVHIQVSDRGRHNPLAGYFRVLIAHDPGIVPEVEVTSLIIQRDQELTADKIRVQSTSTFTVARILRDQSD